ncbi:predicted protein [Nematostella vectensis]|uniref:G-protein coupled receptors family 1 profile domain-containing protein n=1 Tax=Nematostella vectensis TaxID=45351 RepID=A7SL67_NEMVE|nr:predicted protein [Nematostella vectensis]|eukprot:XP_001627651.1 predicted protein [Nematostella vectensis]
MCQTDGRQERDRKAAEKRVHRQKDTQGKGGYGEVGEEGEMVSLFLVSCPGKGGDGGEGGEGEMVSLFLVSCPGKGGEEGDKGGIWFVCSGNQRMKNATNYLIVNLAVSELVTVCTTMVMKFYIALIYPKRMDYLNQVFATVICKFFIAFLDVFCHSLAMLSLTVIAFDRFFGVRQC